MKKTKKLFNILKETLLSRAMRKGDIDLLTLSKLNKYEGHLLMTTSYSFMLSFISSYIRSTNGDVEQRVDTSEHWSCKNDIKLRVNKRKKIIITKWKPDRIVFIVSENAKVIWKYWCVRKITCFIICEVNYNFTHVTSLQFVGIHAPNFCFNWAHPSNSFNKRWHVQMI